MKVLIVASLAESLINFRGHLMIALQEKGLEVHVAAPRSAECEIRNALESLGIVTHEIRLSRTGMNPLMDIVSLWTLWVLMLKLKPDMIISYTIKPAIYGTLAAWLAGVQKRFVLITGLGYAFTSNTSSRRSLVKSIARKLYSITLKKATKVFFQNPDDETLFRVLGLVPRDVATFVLNGSGVDLTRFNMAPLPKIFPRFLLIARLLIDKGVREYVEAARQVRSAYPMARFSLVGWIDTNPNSIGKVELDQWVREGVVEFLGELRDVRSAIEDCSVYVLPSYREGTPRTVLEAMAMGRPIITTDAPGCRETVVDGHNGFLVPIQSVAELVEAMTRFIKDPKLVVSMGFHSRQLVEEKYDVKSVNSIMIAEMGIL